MNKTSGRILSVLLAIFMLAVFVPAQVFAIVPPTPNVTAEDFDYETYTEDGVTKLALLSYFGIETALVFPNEMGGLPIGTIGAYLFCDNANITSVILPESLKTIGSFAFSSCTSLESITIPNGITEIGTSAFSGCNSLASITVASGNQVYHSAGNCLIHTESKTLIVGCKNSIIPAGGSVTTIGQGSFRYCNSLTSITIPQGVTEIGEWAFEGCTALASITLPASLTEISENAFSNCTALASITVASGNSLYHSAGNCMIETASKTLIWGCKNSVIPADGSVTTIGNAAFARCISLTSITIPEDVTAIGEWAFSNCIALASITLPQGVTEIGEYAFSSCAALASITLSESVTAIGEGAFEDCTALRTIYGVSGSYAETYAHNNGYTFVMLTVQPVTASLAEGNVAYGTTIELSTLTEGADIYYTTDSSDPSDPANTARKKYEAPIAITKDVTIKACATKTGYSSSSNQSLSYTVSDFILSGSVNSLGGVEDVSILLYSSETTDAEILADVKTNSSRNALDFSLVMGDISSIGNLYTRAFSFVHVPAGTYKLALYKAGKNGVKILTFTGEETVIDAGEIVIDFVEAGDVDGNGEIGMEDLTLLAKYLANWDVTVNATGAKVSGESEIGMSDLLLLAKYLANWDVTLGAA